MIRIRRILALLLALSLSCLPVGLAEDGAEVQILLSDDQITVNGEVLGEAAISGVQLQLPHLVGDEAQRQHELS